MVEKDPEEHSEGRSRKDFRISRGPNKNVSSTSGSVDGSVRSSSSSHDHDTGGAPSRASSLTPVKYMNGDVLSRPLKLPATKRIPAIIIVAIAIVIGAVFLSFYYDDVVNRPIREQAEIDENISRDVSLDLPDLLTLIPLDDTAIMATLEAQGGTYYERSADTGNTSVFDVIKLPDDVSLMDAAAMYLTGINKLSGTQASLLLNGSWDLDVDRRKGLNMSVHYADFHAETVDAAIRNAMAATGLDQTELAESGEDNSGNTFSSGNVVVGDATYAWRISALPLSEVYSIQGLPNDAVYVGIRITS